MLHCVSFLGFVCRFIIHSTICMTRVRSKRWCFTLNNYSEDDVLLLQSKVLSGHLTYLIFGREVGQLGTPHLQGYCETKQRIGLRSIKEILGNSRFHLEKAIGSLESNRIYCSKEGNSTELGKPHPEQVLIIC